MDALSIIIALALGIGLGIAVSAAGLHVLLNLISTRPVPVAIEANGSRS